MKDLLVGLNKGGVMNETYLKVILISAVGGLYMIAYSLFYSGLAWYRINNFKINKIFLAKKE